jgi:hypothetical protein
MSWQLPKWEHRIDHRISVSQTALTLCINEHVRDWVSISMDVLPMISSPSRIRSEVLKAASRQFAKQEAASATAAVSALMIEMPFRATPTKGVYLRPP